LHNILSKIFLGIESFWLNQIAIDPQEEYIYAVGVLLGGEAVPNKLFKLKLRDK